MKIFIDNNSPIPKYFQLESWFIEQIKHGIYKPGDKIPTEHEIAANTGLARTTVQRALQNLLNEGYISRFRHRGSFVKECLHNLDHKK